MRLIFMKMFMAVWQLQLAVDEWPPGCGELMKGSYLLPCQVIIHLRVNFHESSSTRNPAAGSGFSHRKKTVCKHANVELTEDSNYEKRDTIGHIWKPGTNRNWGGNTNIPEKWAGSITEKCRKAEVNNENINFGKHNLRDRFLRRMGAKKTN